MLNLLYKYISIRSMFMSYFVKVRNILLCFTFLWFWRRFHCSCFRRWFYTPDRGFRLDFCCFFMWFWFIFAFFTLHWFVLTYFTFTWFFTLGIKTFLQNSAWILTFVIFKLFLLWFWFLINWIQVKHLVILSCFENLCYIFMQNVIFSSILKNEVLANFHSSQGQTIIFILFNWFSWGI